MLEAGRHAVKGARPMDRLEAILGIDISIISTGPERDQTILLPTPTLKQWGLV